MRPRASSSPPQVSGELIARRKEVFKLFDDANISPSHIRVCLVASAGFFTDGYSLYTLNFLFPMLVYAYSADASIEKLRVMIKSSIWVGSLFGHLLFGYMTDRCGRKKMFGIELIIVIIGSVFSAMAGQGPTLSFAGTFLFCRFILGIGVGGDYPISALIISELAPIKFRGTMLAAGFAIFTFGVLSAGIVSVIALVAFRASIHQNLHNFDYVWRLTIGLGAVPAIIALYFRLSIPETPRYLIDVEKEIDWTRNIEMSRIGSYEYQRQHKPAQNTSKLHHLLGTYQHFRSKKSGKYLIVACITWFCANISPVAYPGYALIVINKSRNLLYNTFLETYLNYVFWLFLGHVPAALLAVYLIDRWGRKSILCIGFTACAVLHVILGFLKRFAHIDNPNQSTLYYTVSTVYLFFLTFGPRAVTFVIPAELFPTRYRSTAYGISAAFGKISSIFTFVISEWIYGGSSIEKSHTRFFVASILWAVLMVIGAASTTRLPETKNEPLEKIADDDELNAKHS